MFKRYVYIEGLTSLLGSNGKYLINNDGQIKDVKGNDISIQRDAEGHRVVHCQGWDGERDYRVIDLVAIQFKGLCIPLEDYDKVIAFVIDGDKDHVHAKNIGYRFSGGRLEHRRCPGFYYVPGATALCINEEGDLINSKSDRIRKCFTTKSNPIKNIKGGYKGTSFSFSTGVTVGFFRHRALCLVFKDYPDHVDSLTVNHKNGVPGDDWLDNLEWATRGENNKHAYENDLKSQHMHILVRDVRTGKVTEYYSIAEAARQLNIGCLAGIHWRISKGTFGKVYADGHQYKLKSDERDWVIPDDPEAAIRAARSKIPILVRDCVTLEEMLYESTVAASRALGINRAAIAWRLAEKNASPMFGYQFKSEDDERPWPDFSDAEYKASLAPNSFAVDARNLLTGETKTFSSLRKAKKEFGPFSIKDCSDGRRQPLLSSGWQLKRRDDAWEDVEDFEETIYKLKRDMMARCEATGEVILAESALQLSQILGLDPKSIRKAAFTRGNAVYHGYRFRLGITAEPWPETRNV